MALAKKPSAAAKAREEAKADLVEVVNNHRRIVYLTNGSVEPGKVGKATPAEVIMLAKYIEPTKKAESK